MFKDMTQQRRPPAGPRSAVGTASPYRFLIGSLLVVSLIAFELFNFDTTQYALTDFLGDESFIGLRWATILAIAFCAIDFAGLVRIFVPDSRKKIPTEVWYLMGAWLLGATLNAIMTWWAVSLTLLNHEIGNEILSRAQLLRTVPIFVASLVWLTRILFIGSLSVAGNYFFDSYPATAGQSQRPAVPQGQPKRAPRPQRPNTPPLVPVTDKVPAFLEDDQPDGEREPASKPDRRRPAPTRVPARPQPNGMAARERSR